MLRDELIRRLSELHPPTPASCFVLLWTYFEHDEVGLSSVEDLVRSRYRHVLLLPPCSFHPNSASRDLSSALRELPAFEGAEQDLRALRLLKGLDLLLREGEFSDFGYAKIRGIDGKPYTLRRRNPFLALQFGESLDEASGAIPDAGEKTASVTSVARQGLSLTPYCRHHIAVPCRRVRGLKIFCRPSASWGSPYVHLRLQAERAVLRVMLWPFQCDLDYPALEAMRQKPRPVAVTLDQINNEAAVQKEVAHAIEQAAREKVTLLVFPELAIPPATDRTIRQILTSHGRDGYPLLTLYGCSHRRKPMRRTRQQPSSSRSAISAAPSSAIDGWTSLRKTIPASTGYPAGRASQ